jgi:HEAT repeat protein
MVAGKSVAWWLENLTTQDSSAILRGDAPLAQAGPEIIPSLIHAIESPSTDGSFLSRHQQWAPAFLRKYLPKQKTAGSTIRTVAAFRLGQYGPAASNAVPCLTELLKKPPQYADRGRVIQALGNIGPPARQAVPGLVEALTNQSEWIRMTAAQSLLQIRVVPREAIPALEQNLKCTDYIAAKMAVAIWAAEPSPEALSRIQSMLTNSGYGQTAASTAAALGLLSEVPQELMPILTRMMDKDNASVRQGAALALARPHAENVKRIVEVLVEGVNAGEFRIPCAEALGNMGSDALTAKAALQKAQLHPDEGYVLSNAAARAFARIPAE